MPEPLLEIRDLTKIFVQGSRRILAVDHASLDVARGSSLGIVGESGSGKTTLARMIVGLVAPTRGTIRMGDAEAAPAAGAGWRHRPRDIQMVFQDPFSSLNPSFSVGQALLEGISRDDTVTPPDRIPRAVELLEAVALSAGYLDRRPRELSGGERQRVGIARALSVRPRMLIADEAVAALDVSVQAQILNVFVDLRRRLGLTLVVISHDLTVIRYLCDEVAVMRAGRVVERGEIGILQAPQHLYTQELLAASNLRLGEWTGLPRGGGDAHVDG